MSNNYEVEEGIVEAPERIAMIGEGGLGKTSFAACAPYPFFLDIERGTRRIRHVARNKEPIEKWVDLKGTIDWLLTSKHPYKTVVLDTLDRAEWLCWKFLQEQDGVGSIEQVAKGFGKGYNVAYEQFRVLFSMFEQLAEKRDMHVIILAHPKLEKIRNPNGADYERHTFKVHSAIGNLMYEACDHVLFAQRNTVVAVAEETFEDGRPRAVGGDQRIMHTQGGPTRIAKSRVTIPDPLPLSWHDWVCYLASAGFQRLLRETVVENARRLGDPEIMRKTATMVADTSRSPKNYVALLAEANKRLAQMLGTPGTSVGSAPAEPEHKPESKPEQPTKQPEAKGESEAKAVTVESN
jgi:hypothetical protein